jgi:hypothetical protein
VVKFLRGPAEPIADGWAGIATATARAATAGTNLHPDLPAERRINRTYAQTALRHELPRLLMGTFLAER